MARRNVLQGLGRPARARGDQSATVPPTPGEESGVTTGETVVLGDPAALQPQPGQGSEAPPPAAPPQ